MNLRSATGTALAILVALSLGMGSASAAEHHTSPAAAASTYAPGPGTAVRGGPDMDFLTGYPREIHTDERKIDAELEVAEAAPHTLSRFHAGSA